MENKEIDFWGVIALFGHNKIAGKLSSVTLGSAVMVRVDVPQTTNIPAYYKLFNTSAIYDMTPTDEETARVVAEHLSAKPLPDIYTIQRHVEQRSNLLLEALKTDITEDDGDDF
jgi:hypothetical protein